MTLIRVPTCFDRHSSFDHSLLGLAGLFGLQPDTTLKHHSDMLIDFHFKVIIYSTIMINIFGQAYIHVLYFFFFPSFDMVIKLLFVSC